MANPACIVIGDAAVTVRCAQIARQSGLDLLGVVTADPRLTGWAAQSSIPCCFAPPRARLQAADLERLAGGKPFDLLFSIHNLRILGPDVLALPRRLAVNFHDALLPRYAGLHATTWAILQGETEHGITWHRIAERVDAGEVLLQRRLALDPEETAWTLNTRCAEAAIASFPELLAKVAGTGGGAAGGEPQDPSLRTFFPGWRRPAPGGVVPWDRSAREISAFVRGLEFGPADQPLGMAKLLAPRGTFLIREIDVLARRSGSLPGTVVAAGSDGCEIATATTDVRLRTVTDLRATVLAPTEHAECFGVAPGLVLPAEAPNARALSARERALTRHEAAWTAVLCDLAPLVPPLSATGRSTETRASIDLPQTPVASPDPDDPAPEDWLLGAVLSWLAHEVGQPFDVAFGEPALRQEIAENGWSGILQSRPPLRVELRSGDTPRAFAVALRAERIRRAESGTYALDLPARSRRLRSTPGQLHPVVAVDLSPANTDGGLEGYELTLGIYPATRRVTLHGAGSGALAQRCAAYLGELASRFDAPCPRRRGDGARALSDRPQDLVAVVHEVARRRPEATAIEVEGRCVTYRSLAERAARLARALRRRGIRREQVVALRLDASGNLIDLVTALLAVLEAGAAFLVLDPLDPPARLESVLAIAQPALVLGDARGLAPRLAARFVVQPMALADADEHSPALADQPDPDIRPSDLAYLAFTSGTSGEPKGVAIERDSLAHYIEQARAKFALSAGDRLLQIGSAAFDLAYEQIFVSLASGGTLVGLAVPGLPPTRELLDRCRALAITALDLPTAHFDRMGHDIERLALTIPPALRLVVIGGEAAATGAAERWQRALPHASRACRLLNTYGPTEATIVAAWREFALPCELPRELSSLPIGRAVPGVEALVLDRQRLPVPAGEAGELWLGGVGLARGYHRRPETTAERFQPLGCAAGRRFYRTGDRVRELPDGDLEFLGRLDRQVKIAGRRIEPEEVEIALRSIHGVFDVAVAAQATEGGAPRLTAWLVLAPCATLEAVRREATRRLPPHMLPRLEAVAALPWSASGKVDLHALRALVDRTAPLKEAQQAEGVPRDGTERRLATIWQELLGGPDARRDTDFFAVGADSLAAVGLLAEIEHAFGRRVGMSALLRAPTIAGLAALLDRPSAAGRRPPRSSLVPLQPLGEMPPIYCAHGLGGHLLRLLPLAAALAPGQPFFGLESPGLDDEEPVPPTIEELASRFLADVRSHRNDSPLHLAGMSYGGLVAFEMARLAVESGQSVALLAMFDSDLTEILPDLRPPTPGWRHLALARLRRAVGDALGATRRRLRRLGAGRDQVRKANEYRHFTRVLRINDASLGRYRPGPYGGHVTFLAATARDPAVYGAFAALTGCTLEIVPMPGGHLGMLESPHVERLAEELRRRVAASTAEVDRKTLHTARQTRS